MTTTLAECQGGGCFSYDGTPPSLHSDHSDRVRQKADASFAVAVPDTAQQVPEQEIAKKLVSRQIARHTTNGTLALPRRIVLFLEQSWRSHLTRLFNLEGEKGQRWRDAVQTMELLAWSVQPKEDTESRERLLAVLPRLLHQLHVGLKSLGQNAAEEDKFFAELAKLHVAALNPETAAAGVSTRGDKQKNDVDENSTNGRQADNGANDGPQPTNRLQRPLQPDPTAKRATSNPDSLQELVVGTSIQLRGQRGAARIMRLTWISGQRGVFLFRDRQNDHDIFLTAARLNQCLQDGSARILKA